MSKGSGGSGTSWGCIIVFAIGGVLLLCCGGGVGIFFMVTGIIKSSDVYTEAVARAQANDEVKALLGEPIEPGFLVTGSININNNNGNANLVIPLSGPKGSASMTVIANKAGGPWQYSTLNVIPAAGGNIIDLRDKGAP